MAPSSLANSFRRMLSVAAWVMGLSLALAGSLGNAAEAGVPISAQTTVLRSFYDGYNLPPAEQAMEHPVQMEITAYYYDPYWKLLWGADQNGPLYVPLESTILNLKAGQRFRVEGQIASVGKGLNLPQSKVTILGEAEWPKPISANGRFADLVALNGQFVTVEGYVNRQLDVDENHLLLDMAIDGYPAQARVLVRNNSPVPQVEGSTIRFRAIYVGSKDPQTGALRVSLWIPNDRQIEFLHWMEDDPAFDLPETPIEALSSVRANTKVRVVGLVRSQVPRTSVVIRDETGQATIETAMARPVKPGERIEAVGYPVYRGTTWVLQQGLFRRAQTSEPPARPKGLSLLRLIDQVRELPREEAERGYPVAVSGIVTWVSADGKTVFLLDSTSGIEIEFPSAALVAGQRISVRGTTAAGTFAPVVHAASWNVIEEVPLPEPRPITWEHAMTGVEQGQWVSMNGFVRSAKSLTPGAGGGSVAELELTTSGGEFTALVTGEANESRLIGSSVRLAGVCRAITNTRRQLTGVQLLVPFPNNIEVEEARPADPFQVAERSIASLRQFNTLESLIHRVRIKGVVVNQLPGVSINLQEDTEGLLVLTNQSDQLSTGDIVEAVGFPGRQRNRVVLREAVYRKVGHDKALRPVPVGHLGAIDPELDGRLIQAEALLLDVGARKEGLRLTCQSAGLVFEALLPGERKDVLAQWRPGARLAISGVYEVQYDDYHRPHAVQLHLRSTDDVSVVENASWWTVEHALLLAAVFGLTVLLGLFWVFSLQHRVRRQTEQIREEMEKSRNLEAELFRSSKLESLGVLAGGIAHDFNNLLTVVMGNISLVLSDERIDGENRHSLKQSEQAAVRARDLTQQLLTFSKGGAPVRSAIAVPDIVREAAGFASHGSNVRCDFDFEPHLWPADADKSQLAQVVHNIVLNGIQAMSHGGVLRIGASNCYVARDEVATLAEGRYLKLSFTDSGPGISAENLTRIFDPYFTTKKHGNGLGLATVYSIVKRHHGQIDVKSELGQGTTFQVWLPAAEAPAQEKPAVPTALPRRSGRVLVMDDEPGIRQLITSLLQRIGFNVTAVPDGAAVVREYRRAKHAGETIACVILDLTVPAGMGGAEAMMQLREIDPDVCAVVSSGYSKDPIVANFRAHGFRGIMPKPYNVEDVVKVISTVVPA